MHHVTACPIPDMTESIHPMHETEIFCCSQTCAIWGCPKGLIRGMEPLLCWHGLLFAECLVATLLPLHVTTVLAIQSPTCWYQNLWRVCTHSVPSHASTSLISIVLEQFLPLLNHCSWWFSIYVCLKIFWPQNLRGFASCSLSTMHFFGCPQLSGIPIYIYILYIYMYICVYIDSPCYSHVQLHPPPPPPPVAVDRRRLARPAWGRTSAVGGGRLWCPAHPLRRGQGAIISHGRMDGKPYENHRKTIGKSGKWCFNDV